MPEFSPGESRTAIVAMSNPTAKAFDYVAELYMGTDLALMAQAPFHLEAEESEDISLPVTMPSVAGAYPVHIGVFSGGQSIGLYKAVEDVIITAEPEFYMPAEMNVKVTDGTILGMYWTCEFSVTITNKGNAPGTHTIEWWDNCGVVGGSRTITLQPGESYSWGYSGWVDFRRLPGDYGVSQYTMWLSGDWEANNISSGTAKP